jgi:polyhydroxyalkanoate synthase subunit PhaC
VGRESKFEPVQNETQDEATGPATGDHVRSPLPAIARRASSAPSHQRMNAASISAPSFAALDRSLRAAQARATQGLSPTAVVAPWADWAFHLARAPGKQTSLALLLQGLAARYALCTVRAVGRSEVEPLAYPAPGDRRFAAPAWAKWPFNAAVQAYLFAESWWLEATRHVPGVTHRHEEQVAFMMRQLADIASQTNIPWLNPTIIERTMREGGLNLLHGLDHWLEDWQRQLAGMPPSGTGRFVVGRDLAVTSGRVVFRNDLMD